MQERALFEAQKEEMTMLRADAKANTGNDEMVVAAAVAVDDEDEDAGQEHNKDRGCEMVKLKE